MNQLGGSSLKPSILPVFTPGSDYAGWFLTPQSPASSTTNGALGANTLRLSVCRLPAMRIIGIGAEVTAGGVGTPCMFRPALYRDANGMPGLLVLDPGSFDASIVGVTMMPCDITITEDNYWLGGTVQGTVTGQPTLRAITGGSVVPYVPIMAGNTPPVGTSSYGYGYVGVAVAAALPTDMRKAGIVPVGSGTPEPRIILQIA